MPRKAKTLEDRFAASFSPEPMSGCWLWTGKDNGKGYGIIGMIGGRGGKNVYAHRVSYELFVGAIPEGLTIDHLCSVRCCVNPTHLEAVTQRENTQRGGGAVAVRRRCAAITHCPQGHEYTPENTYVRGPTGKYKYHNRQCRACSRGRNRKASRSRRTRTMPTEGT